MLPRPASRSPAWPGSTRTATAASIRRAAGAGGDATLLVPTHEVDLPTWGRPANPVVVGPAAKSREAVDGEATSSAVAANAAQTQRAVDAYQRYGQTPGAATPTPDPLPAVNVTPPPAPITLAAAPSASPDLAPTATATPNAPSPEQRHPSNAT